MKILIADKLADEAVSQLEELGAHVTVDADLNPDTLPASIQDNEVLIVRSTKVKADTIGNATNLSLIIRAGAGVNTIDLKAANEKGIHVANCPGKNTDAVAELAIGLMIAADRRIVNASVDLRNGVWNKKEYSKARGLKGRTLGIIGMGAIGKSVTRKAQGLGMEVIAWSRNLTEDQAAELGIEYKGSINEVAAEADVLSLHLASNDDTRGIINKEFLAQMKDGSILINSARGEVVNTKDLKTAIKEKGLRVGFDVFEDEPTGGKADFNDTELADLITCTPHVGASTDQSTAAVADEVINIIKAYKNTGKPLNGVNQRQKSTAQNNLVVRHFNQVGVLAGVFDALRYEKINIEEMENMIFETGCAASCSLKLDVQPSAALIEKIASAENIIQVMLK
jgi:D-3-phosphoglycerate dehydrogenase